MTVKVVRVKPFPCIGAAVIAGLVLPACSPPPRRVAAAVTCPVVPQTVHLVLDASDRLNPDSLGRALPTQVRVYQLKSVARLEEAEFTDVWQHPAETLRDDVISSQEVTLYPGTSTQRAFPRDPAARFVAAVAIVRRPAGAAWRATYDLPAPPEQTLCAARQRDPNANPVLRDPRFHFLVDGYRIEAEEDPEPPPPARGSGGTALPGALPTAPAMPGFAPPEAPAVEAPAPPEAPGFAPPAAPEAPAPPPLAPPGPPA